MRRLLSHFSALRKGTGWMLWAIWPRLCPGCNAVPAAPDALGLCPLCRLSLWPNDGPRCRACDGPRPPHNPLGGGPQGAPLPCNCLLRTGTGAPRLAGVRAPWRYDGALACCIVHGKFSGARFVFTALGQRLAEDAAVQALARRCDAVVPIPSTPARLRQRGFNPATLLAVALARAVQRPLTEALVRCDNQVAHSRQSRAARVAQAPQFAPCTAAPRRALLVDDVLTTGSTLRAAAKVLHQAGSERVAAVVVARRA